ncbi:MAG: magnesium protoporphyrin IX methyltransferase [Thermaurantiacus sp.]
MASVAPSAGKGWARSRAALEAYFDRTAFRQWEALTSDARVSRIRETVRAGRDAMRANLLSWLPEDMGGLTLLDAGCGTGALAVEAARRGAAVTAIDVSGQLIGLAQERAPQGLGIDWRVGDMLDPGLGTFDHVVAMDSLIHYALDDMAVALGALAGRTRRSLLFTFAPRTPLLSAMHGVGKLFPQGDRAPAIQPVERARLDAALAVNAPAHRAGRHRRIASGFYTSEAQELVAT